MRLFPHPSLSEEHVRWGEWRVVTADSSEVLLDHLKGWDYQQELSIQVECQLNVAAACQGLGVDAEEIVFLATVDCTATSQRFIGSVRPSWAAQLREVPSDYEGWRAWNGAAGRYYLGFWEEEGIWAVTDSADVVLEDAASEAEALEALQRIDAGAQESWQGLTATVRIPRESVANRLEMAVQFVVMPRVDRAHGPGARVLAGPKKRTMLEGDGARFPTEPVSFNSMGWQPALWRVNFDFDGPDDAFAGAVRLFVNVDHPGSSSLLDPEATGGDITRAFLRLDIVRVVLTKLAREASLLGAPVASRDEDETSVVSVADQLSRQWLKLDLDEALLLVDRSPEKFELGLQAAALDLGKKAFA
ncbi:hypothetical protein ACTHQ1_03615 [Janibacter anophelis]|uniref:hypothetical protein n=1 Tax=Janibacter anophelis TaxID=319054 RepID=UPI003F7D6425